MPTTMHREVIVAPDRFEVVADDAVLVAELRSATAVCIYDAVEEAGALLHLRFIIRSNKPADASPIRRLRRSCCFSIDASSRCARRCRTRATCRRRSLLIFQTTRTRSGLAIACSHSSATSWTTPDAGRLVGRGGWRRPRAAVPPRDGLAADQVIPNGTAAFAPAVNQTSPPLFGVAQDLSSLEPQHVETHWVETHWFFRRRAGGFDARRGPIFAATPRLDQREHHQAQRIRRGVSSGELDEAGNPALEEGRSEASPA